MTEAVPALAAAFLAGLLGSAHCLGMCAGLSGLFAVQAEVASLRTRLPLALTYNGGRIVGYALLGLAVGTLGGGAIAALPALATPVRITGGLVIVLIGLRIAFAWRLLEPLERMGAVLWARFAPLARRLLPVTSVPRALGLGLLWGWLPCGLVYSVLLLATTTATPAEGALLMALFGCGTLPAMLTTGLGAARLGVLLRRRHARLGLGASLVILGLATLALPLLGLLQPAPHSH